MTDTILDENVSWFSRGKKEKVDNRPAKLNEKKSEWWTVKSLRAISWSLVFVVTVGRQLAALL